MNDVQEAVEIVEECMLVEVDHDPVADGLLLVWQQFREAGCDGQ